MSSRREGPSHGRHGGSTKRDFSFKAGDLVLVKWSDGMVYFAKIKRVDHKRRKCTVVFDDKSQDEAHFSQIHSVDETTTDIICIKCKKDDSNAPNEIVLCDTCGIGYHQKCHVPSIPTNALNIDTPWQCTYCMRGEKCPYLTESLDVLQNLLSDESDSNAEDDIPSVLSVLSSDHYLSEDGSVTSQTLTSPHGKRRSRRVAEGRPTKRDTHLDRMEPYNVDTLHVLSDKKRSHISNADSVRHKLAAPPLSDTRTTLTVHRSTLSLTNQSIDSDVMYSPDSTPQSTPEPHSDSHKKRKRKHMSGSSYSKRHKRASVDTRTLSVTRLPGPTPVQETTKLSISDQRTDVKGLESVSENAMEVTPVVNGEPRPRSLRISLSIQDDTESGVVRIKTPRVTPKSLPQSHISNDLPNWEDFSHKAQASPDTIDEVHTSIKNVFPTVVLKTNEDNVTKKRKLSVISQAGKSLDKPLDDYTSPTSSNKKTVTPRTEISPSAFTASPLPISSPPEFKSINDVFEMPATSSSTPYTSTGVTEMNVSLSRPLLETLSPITHDSHEQTPPVVCPTQDKSSDENSLESKPPSPKPNSECVATSIEDLTTIKATSPSTLSLSKPSGTPVVSNPPPTCQSLVTTHVSSQPHTLPSALSSQPQGGHGLTKTVVVKTPEVVSVTRVEDNKIIQLQHTVHTALPTKELPDQHNTVHTGVVAPPTKELPDQRRTVRTAPPTKELSDQRHTVHTAPPTKELSDQQHIVHIAPPTKELPVQHHTVHTGVVAPPTKELPDQRHAVHTAPPTKELPDQRHTVHTAPPTKELPDQRHTVHTAPPTKELPDQQHIVHIAPPTKELPDQHHTVHTAPPTKELPDQRHTVHTAPPTKELPDQHHTDVITPPTKVPTVISTNSPVEHVVSGAMSPALSLSLTNINTPDKIVTSAPSRTIVVPRPLTPNDDVIITAVETKQSRAATTPMHELQGTRPAVPSQQMRKVTARTIDIQQTKDTRTETATTPVTRVHPPHNRAGSLVQPIASQTPVSTTVPVMLNSSQYPSSRREPHIVQSSSNKQIYYCVQSGGKPVYIPASVIHQARSRREQQIVSKEAAPVFTPPIQNKAIESPIPHSIATTSQLYYTADLSMANGVTAQAAPVNTTKPYAYVNAIPSTAGVHLYPRHIQQVCGGEGVPESPVLVSGTRVPGKQVHSVTDNLRGNMGVIRTPPPPPSYPGTPVQQPDDLVSNLQTINKKISAAFVNCSEEMLISAFEDAWKKFQANGQKYVTSSKQSVVKTAPVPPNAEVVNIPGSVASRLSLLRPVTGQRPRPIAPKPSRVCALCKREATYLCSGCRLEWYCGRDCQLKAWDHHSETCRT